MTARIYLKNMKLKVPFWVYRGRNYPATLEISDHNGDPGYIHKNPRTIIEGIKVNNIRVIRVEKQQSHAYDLDFGHFVKDSPHEHRTGKLLVRCTLCAKLFIVDRRRICPNHPARSMWSCGCQKRPRGQGLYAETREHQVLSGERRAKTARRDLTGLTFGQLEVFHYLPNRGWLCLCHQCKNPDGCVVPKGVYLCTGKLKACFDCQPYRWRGINGS